MFFRPATSIVGLNTRQSSKLADNLGALATRETALAQDRSNPFERLSLLERKARPSGKDSRRNVNVAAISRGCSLGIINTALGFNRLFDDRA